MTTKATTAVLQAPDSRLQSKASGRPLGGFYREMGCPAREEREICKAASAVVASDATL